MSNAVLPTLPGMAFPRERHVRYATDVQRSDSMRNWRLSRALYPVYEYTLNFNFLRAADLITLRTFFEAHKGRGESWLFDDRDDRLQNDSASPQVFGVGNGVQRDFQLIRSQGGVLAPIGRHNVVSSVRINGTPTVAYTLDDFGGINFTTAPAAAAVLDWQGSFYWRCAFMADVLQLKEFLRNISESKSLKFETEKP